MIAIKYDQSALGNPIGFLARFLKSRYRGEEKIVKKNELKILLLNSEWMFSTSAMIITISDS